MLRLKGRDRDRVRVTMTGAGVGGGGGGAGGGMELNTGPGLHFSRWLWYPIHSGPVQEQVRKSDL